MILFLSDLHVDHDPSSHASREAERSAIACLKHYRTDLTEVVLLGDLFDAYVEYRHLVPKGLTRLLGLLSDWVSDGLRVTAYVGNHDPWHRTWFEDELGFTLRRTGDVRSLYESRVYAAHGDLEEHGGASRTTAFLRHPLVHALYTTVLPGDSGQRLARWTSRRFRSTEVDPATREALESAARAIIGRGQADTVIFGHSHVPELLPVNGGVYSNTGSWMLSNHFLLLGRNDLSLMRWIDGHAEVVQRCDLPR